MSCVPDGGEGDEIAIAEATEIGTDYDELWERVRGGFAACVRRDATYSPLAIPRGSAPGV